MQEDAAKRLMTRYDLQGRVLPWRITDTDVSNGTNRNPYTTWLSEIMLQQTTVEAAKDHFRRFLSLWPTVEDLAQARDQDVLAAWAGLGYYARARNLLKTARLIAQQGGQFPIEESDLLALPGVGPYTAAAIRSIGHNLPAQPVDGNIERIAARVLGRDDPVPSARRTLHEAAKSLYNTPLATQRPSDFPQALMDLGAQICRPQNPLCDDCPLNTACVSAHQPEAGLRPRRDPKKPKSLRTATILRIHHPQKGWLLQTREHKGLLGGQQGWPLAEHTQPTHPEPPLLDNIPWTLRGTYRHIFTHIDMTVNVLDATLHEDADLTQVENTIRTWCDSPQHICTWQTTVQPKTMPTLMAKAWTHVQTKD